MIIRRVLAIGSTVLLTVTGCAFQGVNSLPLPGTVGRGNDAAVYHVEVANIGTLESNSPVLINDVVVGSVGKMTLNGWHVKLDVSLKPDVIVPANAVATVGQTSLLGSMHVALDPPPGQAPEGRLKPGATIGLDSSSTYPSTERTLSSLAAVVNGGGLGQIGDIVHNFNEALSGRQDAVRDLITRLDTFVGTLYQQRDNIIATIDELNRFSATLGGQQEVLARALNKIPPALDVLIKERPRITTALEHLGTFSETVAGVISDTQADLVKNLQNLAPTLQALADVGPSIDTALAYIPTFPLTQNLIDRGVRGDYVNLFVDIDLTNARIKRGLLLGTRLGQDRAALIPAPGDPGYDAYYTKFPLGVGTSTPFGPIPNTDPAPWEPGGGG
ncbi:virulence factor Mce-like protein [Mycolicibacterium moriokaense]|uniref:Virulence factor Mce-like protein n=1 Tax=Mycolicibacterium moriokaense TaxID=39691 RepID=A0A318HM92_9MYCO|nr:MCE family protein [Mycolicibacterium moriokaense]PXX12250.1 virulence factor Mce-like protein [Mycolicibacterium moriokaense]